MKQQNSKTKKTLLSSIIVLIVCIAMLLGTTFAWFTDSVSNTGNRIQAGTLDVDLLMYKDTPTPAGYKSIGGGSGDIFKEADVAQNSNVTLWEPGKTQIVFLAVKNDGNLALKYNIKITTSDDSPHPSMVQDGYSALEYAILDGVTKEAYDAASLTKWSDITGYTGVQTGDVTIGTITAAENGSIKPADGTEDGTDYFALAVHMKENAGNVFQDAAIIIDVNVVATQETYEKDGFNSDQYDALAQYPVVGVKEVVEGKPTVIPAYDGNNNRTAEATIPANAVPGVSKIEMTVEKTGTPEEVQLEEYEEALNLDVKFFSVSENGSKTRITDFGTQIVNVDLSAQLEDGKILTKVYHTHNGTAVQMTKKTAKADVGDGDYYFDETTKTLTIGSKTFSPFTFVIHEHDYSWISNKNGTHYGKCDCGKTTENEDCDEAGKDGACSKCGYVPPVALWVEGNKTYDSVQEAVNAANTGDTVKLLVDNTITGYLNLNKAITYDLNNHTFSTSHTDAPTIDVSQGATITNGTVSGKKYGIYCESTNGITISSLTINNVNFGVYEKSGTVSAISNVIMSNLTTAGIYVNGGSIVTISGLTTNNCKYGIYNKGAITSITSSDINANACGLYNWNGTIQTLNADIWVNCSETLNAGIYAIFDYNWQVGIKHITGGTYYAFPERFSGLTRTNYDTCYGVYATWGEGSTLDIADDAKFRGVYGSLTCFGPENITFGGIFMNPYIDPDGYTYVDLPSQIGSQGASCFNNTFGIFGNSCIFTYSINAISMASQNPTAILCEEASNKIFTKEGNFYKVTDGGSQEFYYYTKTSTTSVK